LISRRSLFRWLGGAAAAVATAPALLKAKAAKALGFDTIANPWYRTQYDEPIWHEGYDRLPVETGEPVRVIESLSKDAFLKREEGHFGPRADLMRSNADRALDEALQDAFEGRHTSFSMRESRREVIRRFDTMVCSYMGKAGYRPATQPEFHMSAYLRRFGPITPMRREPSKEEFAKATGPFRVRETVIVVASDLELLQNGDHQMLQNLARARTSAALERAFDQAVQGV